MSYNDNSDPEMRNRVFQIVDDVLLGTAKKDSGCGGGGSALTPTSRAVGLALIVSSLKDKENAYKWMCALFAQRSRLQKALGEYLDARSKAREFEAGRPEAFEADREAVEKLELVASYSAPLGETSNRANLESILKEVHAAKEDHIFRILSTISSPTHSSSSRLRAFDELSKRTEGLGRRGSRLWLDEVRWAPSSMPRVSSIVSSYRRNASRPRIARCRRCFWIASKWPHPYFRHWVRLRKGFNILWNSSMQVVPTQRHHR